MTRRRASVCQGCGTRPVRRIRGARYCSPCVGRMPKKDCRECGESFHPDRMTGPRCKPCASAKAHEKRVGDIYGLKPGQYAELLAFQGGGDAITGQKPRSKRLAVDHRHSDGEVRGLLLKHTNLYVVGWLESFDDPFAILDNLRAYLTESPAKKLWGDAVPRQDVS